MKDIELIHIIFSKKDLNCVSEHEAVFVLQLGGLIHEIKRKRGRFYLIYITDIREKLKNFKPEIVKD